MNDILPPKDCRQRLAAAGLTYPKNSCAACGPWAPRQQLCNVELVNEANIVQRPVDRSEEEVYVNNVQLEMLGIKLAALEGCTKAISRKCANSTDAVLIELVQTAATLATDANRVYDQLSKGE